MSLSWLNPFHRCPPAPTDYETVLARLSSDITEAKHHLSEIRLRQRRASLLLNAYGVLLYALWCALWWWGKVPWGLVGVYSDDLVAQGVGLAVVVLGPVGLLLLNRLNALFFLRQRTKEETNLRTLLKSQHDKLEEIKKATNYYSTRDLLEKYDELSRASPASTRRASPGTPTPSSRRPNAPTIRAPLGTPVPTVTGPLQTAQAQAQAQIQRLAQESRMPVLPTPQKKWYDHLADRLLGDDPSQASQTKYALVCGGCFRHNGLVASADEWEQMKWICPRCGYFNPSPKSRRPSPDVPSTPTPPTTTPTPPTPTPSTATTTGGKEPADGIRQRNVSSGLKYQLQPAEGEGSPDRMEVDEPSARNGAGEAVDE